MGFHRIGDWYNRKLPPESRGGIFRLGLFQFAIGLSLALVLGTLNLVLIDHLSFSAATSLGVISLFSLAGGGAMLTTLTDLFNRLTGNILAVSAAGMVLLLACHTVIAPLRAVIHQRSSRPRAQGKWRIPYILVGVILIFGGLALGPFALILLTGKGVVAFWVALIIYLGVFLAYGTGVSIAQTIYLALVNDITLPHERGPVYSVLGVMLILGVVSSSIALTFLLIGASEVMLVRVMQGAAMVFLALAVVSLWRQE